MSNPRVRYLPPRSRLTNRAVQPRKPYLAAIAPRARSPSTSSSRARPVARAPRVRRPRTSQGASSTSPLLRTRLTLPAFRSVHTSSSFPSRATHTAVGTGTPSRRKVVSSTYVSALSRSSSVGMASRYRSGAHRRIVYVSPLVTAVAFDVLEALLDLDPLRERLRQLGQP